MSNKEVVTVNLAEEEVVEDPSLANEEIFPGGPMRNELEKWINEYNHEVYLTEFDEETVFVWRPISRKEYKDIAKIQNADQFYKEERIVEKVILYPENYNFIEMNRGKAGIPTLLSEYVLEKSGFVSQTGALRLS